MQRPAVLPLFECVDARLAGGKAAGLAKLAAAGVPVPPGICLTTTAFEDYVGSVCHGAYAWERVSTLPEAERPAVLEECRRRIRAIALSKLARHWEASLRLLCSRPEARWAVRSSATGEDADTASFAGLYRSHLGLTSNEIEPAVLDLWASVWSEPVIQYWLRQRPRPSAPAMAVVIQPTMRARAAGVCYSIHPVTGRSTQVTVNAVLGLAIPLVEGRVVPDHYVVEIGAGGKPSCVRRREVAEKPHRLMMTDHGLHQESVAAEAVGAAALSDTDLFEVAGLAKRIERAFGHPIDMEWLYDEAQLWVVQARPVTAVRPSNDLHDDECEWTRANFKETLPDLPSPLGLSFLQRFMKAYIMERYRQLGCRIPPGVSAVRVWQGRPYLNATLFYSLVAQLGGEPSFNQEQMGGLALRFPPAVAPLPWPVRARAGWLMWREMRRCEREGPAYFAEMKRQAQAYRAEAVSRLGLDEVQQHLDRLGGWLDRHEMTFGIVAGVGQCLQAFHRFLPAWLGPDWRALFNAALQGQGTVISAQQIMRVTELAEQAGRETLVRSWFESASWVPSSYRQALAGTQFLQDFDRFLEDFGHRALGESDVMTPRMAEQPESLLTVIRARMLSPQASRSADILARQAQVRQHALAEITWRLGSRWDRRLLFAWWYRRLTRFFALREANRHHLMYYSAAVRSLLLRLGELLTAQGLLEAPEDMFFLTLKERAELSSAGAAARWRETVRARRAARARQADVPVPDTIQDWNDPPREPGQDGGEEDGRVLRGLPVSAGKVTGLVRVIASVEQWGRLAPGDILVTPVIDPGMAPILAIAGGVIAEMGGSLSHGAIIAREYGVPAVVNVRRAMTRLPDGARVSMDADAGEIRIEPAADS